MTTGENPQAHTTEEFLRLWSATIAQVLEQIAGAKCAATVVPDAELQPLREKRSESQQVKFAAQKSLTGEFAFSVAPIVALRLAQILLGETPGPEIPLTNDHRDACNELFRQFAGTAATACKAAFDEVEFQFAAAEPPVWTPELDSAWNFSIEGREPLTVLILLSPELVSSIGKPPARAAAQPPAAAAETSPPPPSAETPAEPAASGRVVNEANLALLLDVALDASLRFGQRQMPFKEVLDLRPGSVIELDRRVQEPAELLVAGRVIAKGEVVVVDGNYGLRITEVAQPKDRLQSLDA